ncbi:hypothetical protein [Rhizobium leguminosarum]|uniref:hypothetical protein n=1 Tax=Rhizobium leguminosarum TaxID=384 RepID=UPI001C98E102|nr:hypothetical protein [Rhizobium leguminosarum]
MRRLPEAQQESVLDAMDLALDRGSFPCLQSFIEDYGRDFLENPSASVRERFIALQVAGDKGAEYENVHGRYSLLKVDHPFNRELVAKGIVEMPAMQLATQSSDLGTVSGHAAEAVRPVVDRMAKTLKAPKHCD